MSALARAARSLLRYRLHTAVNLFGLSLGLCCCMLAYAYVRSELSYEGHNPQAERLFRIVTDRTARMPIPLGHALAERLPDVAQAVRIQRPYRPLLVHDATRTYQPVHFVDSNMLEVFGLQLIEGDPRTALREPFRMVISERVAALYFGRQSALGKVLRWDGETVFEVTGVVKVPERTHFSFSVLASYATIETGFAQDDAAIGWETRQKYTYLLLSSAGAGADLSTRINAVLRERAPAAVAQEIASEGGLRLQPIREIHLHSRLYDELQAGGEPAYLIMVVSVATFVLLMACANCAILGSARSAMSARDIGIRRAIGATRTRVVTELLQESLLLTAVAMVAGLVLTSELLPPFAAMVEQHLTLGEVLDGWMAVALGIGVLIVAVAAGGYPALAVSACEPTEAMWRQVGRGIRGQRARRGLVITQFMLAVLLTTSAGTIYRQVQHLREIPLGYNKSQVLVLNIGYPAMYERLPGLQQALRSHSGVGGVAACSALPPQRLQRLVPIRLPGSMTWVQANLINVEPGFVETLGLTVLSGRGFQRGVESDVQRDMVLSRSACAALGISDPQAAVGRQLEFGDEDHVGQVSEYTVLGVVEDSLFEGPCFASGPLIMEYRPHQWAYSQLVVRVTGMPADVLQYAEHEWKRRIPEFPMAFTFLDDQFGQVYRDYERLGRIILGVALLSVAVACLGVLALASHACARRRHEIATRKVLGASVAGATYLLVREVSVLAVAALVIGWPMAYGFAAWWLGRFPYRVEPAVVPYLLAGGLVLCVALLTAACQALRAALANPVDALRQE